MSEMVERVADALFNEDPIPMQMFDRDDIRALARAAIMAMRKPTRIMVSATGPSCRHQTIGRIERDWQSMIDAALSEPSDD